MKINLLLIYLVLSFISRGQMEDVLSVQIKQKHNGIKVKVQNRKYFYQRQKVQSDYSRYIDLARAGIYPQILKPPYIINGMYATIRGHIDDHVKFCYDSLEFCSVVFGEKAYRYKALSDSTLNLLWMDYNAGDYTTFSYIQLHDSFYVYIDQYLNMPYIREEHETWYKKQCQYILDCPEIWRQMQIEFRKGAIQY